MKIVFEDKDYQYIVECENDEFTASELKELFSRLLVLSGFSPDVIQLQGNDSERHYVLIGDDEVVVKRADYEEFERLKGINDGRL